MIDFKRLQEPDWPYINFIEAATAFLIRDILNNYLPSDGTYLPIDQPTITTGNFPEYDFKLNHGFFELKCSSDDSSIKVEYECNDKSSGILISKADFFTFINPGMSKIDGAWTHVYKLRMIPRVFFLARNWRRSDNTNVWSMGSSVCLQYNPKNMVNDGWVADFIMNEQHDTPAGAFQLLKTGNRRNIDAVGSLCQTGQQQYCIDWR